MLIMRRTNVWIILLWPVGTDMQRILRNKHRLTLHVASSTITGNMANLITLVTYRKTICCSTVTK